ncbi:MAG: metallophosphoesterase, partial [Syntrophorhabdales bacterium]
IPANDITYDVPAFGHTRQTEISQDLYWIPYYIVTVDGPKVTVDYYAVNSNGNGSNILTTPALTGNWQKRETFGYSLNGKEFLVAQGQPYTTVQDAIPAGSGFFGTSAEILGGTNGSTVTDHSGRALTKAVNTGWAPRDGWDLGPEGLLSSDVLTLWGMTDVGNTTTDTYALSMTYDPGVRMSADMLKRGKLVLVTKDAKGNWVKAGSKNFILGPWNGAYPLGTYGVDPKTHTAWAVVNVTGDFAVMQTPQP